MEWKLLTWKLKTTSKTHITVWARNGKVTHVIAVFFTSDFCGWWNRFIAPYCKACLIVRLYASFSLSCDLWQDFMLGEHQRQTHAYLSLWDISLKAERAGKGAERSRRLMAPVGDVSVPAVSPWLIAMLLLPWYKPSLMLFIRAISPITLGQNPSWNCEESAGFNLYSYNICKIWCDQIKSTSIFFIKCLSIGNGIFLSSFSPFIPSQLGLLSISSSSIQLSLYWYCRSAW